MKWKIARSFRGNRRLYRRHSIRLEAIAYTASSEHGILLLDWSASGALALAEPNLRTDDSLAIEFSFPEDESGPIKLKARRVREERSLGALEGNKMVGLEFIPNSSEELRLLQKRERSNYAISSGQLKYL